MLVWLELVNFTLKQCENSVFWMRNHYSFIKCVGV
nr:MAG TPA: hypothetical protein [Caudoviricetes sp.]